LSYISRMGRWNFAARW